MSHFERRILTYLLLGLTALTASPALAQTAGACAARKSTTRKPPPVTRTAVCTSYCNRCCGSVTRSGKRLTSSMCAADLRYHKLGTRIRFGSPINRTLTVEDSGGAIHGRDRFDWGRGIVGKCQCRTFGRRRVAYRVVGR